MTISTKNLSRFKKVAPTTSLNNMTFKRKMNQLTNVYLNSDRDKQAFLRKMILIRVEDSGKKLKDPMVSSEEKERIRENLKEYHRTLSSWAGKTSKYGV
jgi:hypothetical protein